VTMAFVCDNCGKSTVHGRSSSHGRGVAGRRWKKRAQTTLRTFKPNLQKIAVMVNGVKVQMRLCADCISRFKKEGKIKKIQSIAAASLG
jgi:ribosomal protein L28